MGLGAVGLAGLLAACGDDSPEASGEAESPSVDPGTGGASPTDDADASTPAEPEETAPDEESEALTTVGEVPVGGGVILDGPGVVVTQPNEGEFVAFSSTCTHQGCAVTGVSDGLITCSCHGSQFSVQDGTVQRGPAERPLDEVPIVVEGDQIRAG